MKRLILVLLIPFLCCNNAKEAAKDYVGKHQEALAFCKANGFNSDYYFLVDLGLHSGKN